MRKILQGKIVQDSLDKTVIVRAIVSKPKLKYLKRIKLIKKYFVHDEHNTCKIGDMVTFIENRPMSKLKKWILLIS